MSPKEQAIASIVSASKRTPFPANLIYVDVVKGGMFKKDTVNVIEALKLGCYGDFGKKNSYNGSTGTLIDATIKATTRYVGLVFPRHILEPERKAVLKYYRSLCHKTNSPWRHVTSVVNPTIVRDGDVVVGILLTNLQKVGSQSLMNFMIACRLPFEYPSRMRVMKDVFDNGGSFELAVFLSSYLVKSSSGYTYQPAYGSHHPFPAHPDYKKIVSKEPKYRADSIPFGLPNYRGYGATDTMWEGVKELGLSTIKDRLESQKEKKAATGAVFAAYYAKYKVKLTDSFDIKITKDGLKNLETYLLNA